MWDERYAVDEFVYGTEPNAFLAEHAGQIKGPVLSLAEGEGRNAVFLASLGLDVLGVDGSEVGVAKAQCLARSRRVTIQTQVMDLSTFEPAPEAYQSVVSIFAHLPVSVRKTLYSRVERTLRPGGLLLLEAYSENQLGRGTGGPKDPELLMTVEKISREFPALEPVLLREVERDVTEGRFHTGMASVVQFMGRKKPDNTAIITCPECGQKSAQEMPTDACVFFFECPDCHTILRPKAGDCCVFCSYGSEPCPPKREDGSGSCCQDI